MKQAGTTAAASASRFAALAALSGAVLLPAGGTAATAAAPLQAPDGTAGSGRSFHPATADAAARTARGAIGFPLTLEGTLSTDRLQYAPGRSVVLRVAIRNTGPKPQVLDTGPQYPVDITIRDSRTGHAFWNWSRHRSRPAPGKVTLAPGQEIAYRALWDQTSDAGAPLPRGTYNVVASFNPSGKLTMPIVLSGRSESTGGIFTPPPAAAAGAAGSLTALPRTVRRGGTVNLTYTITNSTGRPLTVPFRSGQMFDIEAFPAGQSRSGTPIWQWSRGRMFMQMLTQITLAPGQKRVFTEQWMVSSDVPDGAYDLIAHLTPGAPQGNPAAPGGSTAEASARVQVLGGGIRDGNTRAAPDTGQAGSETPTVPLGILLASGESGPYAGRQIWVLGTYRRRRSGGGAAATRSSEWLLEDADGHRIGVVGPAPTDAQEGDQVMISATLRRADDGHLYLAAD